MKSIEYEVLEQSLETGSQGYDPLIINSLVQIGGLDLEEINQILGDTTTGIGNDRAKKVEETQPNTDSLSNSFYYGFDVNPDDLY